MTLPVGTVSRSGGELVVEAPAGLEPWVWDVLADRLRVVPAAVSSDGTATVKNGRAAQLADVLRQWPATRVEWQWDEAAAALTRHTTTLAEDLSVVMGSPVGAQTEWPGGLDLADVGFVRDLRPFQHRDVARLVRMRNGANFSVPGAGKTAVAYAAFALLRGLGDVDVMLVVSPPSAFEAWEAEAAECFRADAVPSLAVRPEIGSRSHEVLVLNYEQLEQRRVLAAVDGWAGSRRVMAVFDEAHRAKAGVGGVRGRGARTLADRSQRRMVLTGTPMPNGVEDLANVFDLVWPGHGRRLAQGDLAHARERAYVRVTKPELGLPALDTRVERVALEPAHRKLYDAVAGESADLLDRAGDDAAEIGKALLRLIAVASNPAIVLSQEQEFSLPVGVSEVDLGTLLDDPKQHVRPAKIVRAAQLVAANAARGRKTLVWSSFVANVRALHETLADHHPAVVTGATPVQDDSARTDRVRELARFRDDAGCGVLIATPQTLGEGTSLQKVCQDQIHVDRGFNAGTFLQSVDRTHRLGMPEDSQPTCTVLVAARTVDERVHRVIDEKVTAMYEALNDPSLPVATAVDEPGEVGLDELLLGKLGADHLRQLLHSVVQERGGG